MPIFLLLFILQSSLAMIFKESQVLIYRNNQPTIPQQKQDLLLIRSIRHFFVTSHSKEIYYFKPKFPSIKNVNGKGMNELLNQTWTIRVICPHYMDCMPSLTLSLRDNVLSMVGPAMEDSLMDDSSWEHFMDYSLITDTEEQSLLIITLPIPPLFDFFSLMQSLEINSKIHLLKLKIIQHDTSVIFSIATTRGYVSHHFSNKMITFPASVSWADLNKGLSNSMPPFFYIISKYPSSWFFRQVNSMALEYQLYCQ